MWAIGRREPALPIHQVNISQLTAVLRHRTRGFTLRLWGVWCWCCAAPWRPERKGTRNYGAACCGRHRASAMAWRGFRLQMWPSDLRQHGRKCVRERINIPLGGLGLLKTWPVLEPAEFHAGRGLFWWGLAFYLFGVGNGPSAGRRGYPRLGNGLDQDLSC